MLSLLFKICGKGNHDLQDLCDYPDYLFQFSFALPFAYLFFFIFLLQAYGTSLIACCVTHLYVLNFIHLFSPYRIIGI